MKIAQRLLGAYAILLALVVAVHFIITPLYDDGSTGFPVWKILDWFMSVGVLIALIASYLQKRRLDGSGTDSSLRQYLEANVTFYAALVLTLWFFWNWFVVLMARDSHPLWEFIDPLFVIIVGVVGLRLWHGLENHPN